LHEQEGSDVHGLSYVLGETENSPSSPALLPAGEG
jgi:hypothetical protein